MYKHAHVVLQIYDGFTPIEKVKLTSLFYWVNITEIPPKYETPDWIKDVAGVAGKSRVMMNPCLLEPVKLGFMWNMRSRFFSFGENSSF